MAEDAINKPAERTEAEKRIEKFRTSIEEALDSKKPEGVLRAVVEIATDPAKDRKEIPDNAVAALKNLDPAKRDVLTTLLTTETIEGITQDSRNLLRALAEKITPGSAPEFGKQKPVEKILSLIDEQIEKLNLGGNIDALAKKVGFESGDATKFLKNFFVGMAAKVMESIAFSFKAFNSNIERMLKTPIALRLHQLNITDEKEQKLYTDAYMKRVKQAPNGKGFRPPESLKDAEAILAEQASTQPSVAAEAQKKRVPVEIGSGMTKKMLTQSQNGEEISVSKNDNVLAIEARGKKITLNQKVTSVEVLEPADKEGAVILFALEGQKPMQVLASAVASAVKDGAKKGEKVEFTAANKDGTPAGTTVIQSTIA